jgi:hypothetical protein
MHSAKYPEANLCVQLTARVFSLVGTTRRFSIKKIMYF